jgi:hypothetical protein
MNTPLLIAADPLVVPARVYDRVWVELIEIAAPSPSGDATASIRLRRFCVGDEGAVHVEPDSQRITVANLLATADEDADLAAAVSAIMGYVAKVGVQQGVVAGA